jgi:hypothetical protein
MGLHAQPEADADAKVGKEDDGGEGAFSGVGGYRLGLSSECSIIFPFLCALFFVGFCAGGCFVCT